MFDFAEKSKKHPYLYRAFEILMVLVLMLYPLRHMHRGLDLWDIGYNYSNFQFMGTDSMDPMWLFSTYLSTAVGHLLTFLPFGKTLLGLNFYTGLTVSVLAMVSYVFCTRELKMPKLVVFIGEVGAISFCWCPTAVLYNYLTYIFMLIAVICIYRGLIYNRKTMLVVAGIALGLNVFVRFSNLPEVVYIFAVWAYGIIEAIPKMKDESATVKKRIRTDCLVKCVKRTLYCIIGYAFAIAVMLIFIGFRYGFSEYFNGIVRLFGMTKTATDYSTKAMIMSIVHTYLVDSYWMIRVAAFAFAGIAFCMIGKHVDSKLGIKKGVNGIFGKRVTWLDIAYVLSVLLSIASIVWLFIREFSAGPYSEYGAITRPGTLLLWIIIISALFEIFRPMSKISDKLLAGLVLITVLVTPIGSNNGLFPAYNNLFLAYPWLVWRVWELIKVKEWPGFEGRIFSRKVPREKRMGLLIKAIKSDISLFPLKVEAVVIGVVLLYWIVAFGTAFSFAEAENAKDPYYTMNENRTVRNIRMSYDKAHDLYGLWQFMDEAELTDNELITYGNIPAIHFYLQMAPAFNPWMDLRSYGYDVMKTSIADVEEEVANGEKSLPVIIVRVNYAVDLGEADNVKRVMLAKRSGIKEQDSIEDDKWKLLKNFISEHEYQLAYCNSFYAVYVNDGE